MVFIMHRKPRDSYLDGRHAACDALLKALLR